MATATTEAAGAENVEKAVAKVGKVAAKVDTAARAEASAAVEDADTVAAGARIEHARLSA